MGYIIQVAVLQEDVSEVLLAGVCKSQAGVASKNTLLIMVAFAPVTPHDQVCHSQKLFEMMRRG